MVYNIGFWNHTNLSLDIPLLLTNYMIWGELTDLSGPGYWMNHPSVWLLYLLLDGLNFVMN